MKSSHSFVKILLMSHKTENKHWSYTIFKLSAGLSLWLATFIYWTTIYLTKNKSLFQYQHSSRPAFCARLHIHLIANREKAQRGIRHTAASWWYEIVSIEMQKQDLISPEIIFKNQMHKRVEFWGSSRAFGLFRFFYSSNTLVLLEHD